MSESVTTFVSPDLDARRVVMSSFLYYTLGANTLGANTLSDPEFDTLCQRVAEHWGELSALRQWQLESPSAIRVSGFHCKVTRRCANGAIAWHETAHRFVLDLTKFRPVWRFSTQHQVWWINAG